MGGLSLKKRGPRFRHEPESFYQPRLVLPPSLGLSTENRLKSRLIEIRRICGWGIDDTEVHADFCRSAERFRAIEYLVDEALQALREVQNGNI